MDRSILAVPAALATLTVGFNARKWRSDRAVAARYRRALRAPTPLLRGAPHVTILVAAWNEAPAIARHIASVRALRYPNWEYVLCAGGADGTYRAALECARGDPRLVVLEQLPGEGKQRALRKAYARATGDVVYLTDADCFVDDESFERVLAPIVNHGEAAATGTSMPLPEQWDVPLVDYQWAVQRYVDAHAPEYASGLLGRNAAVRRDALERAGRFNADVATGTDYHLATALTACGYRLRCVPTSRVRTRYAETWARYAGQQRRWVRNAIVLGARRGGWRAAAAGLQTALVGAGMLALPVLALAAPRGRPLLVPWAVALLHGVVAKARYLAFGRAVEGARLLSPAQLAIFTLREFGVWARPLFDLPSARLRRQW
jgi:cellulose synthase/poly-beta-1,6-N-acetylglucosamine synthase-like glycosyltransferase